MPNVHIWVDSYNEYLARVNTVVLRNNQVMLQRWQFGVVKRRENEKMLLVSHVCPNAKNAHKSIKRRLTQLNNENYRY